MRRSFVLALALLATMAMASCGGGLEKLDPVGASSTWDSDRWDQATWQ
jgi:hypothetical protein